MHWPKSFALQSYRGSLLRRCTYPYPLSGSVIFAFLLGRLADVFFSQMVSWICPVFDFVGSSHGAFYLYSAPPFWNSATLHRSLLWIDCAHVILCRRGTYDSETSRSFSFSPQLQIPLFFRRPLTCVIAHELHDHLTPFKPNTLCQFYSLYFHAFCLIASANTFFSQLHNSLLTLIAAIFQLVSLLWYLISYFPLGSTGLQFMGRFGVQRVTAWVSG
jgi:hypothetical protein